MPNPLRNPAAVEAAAKALADQILVTPWDDLSAQTQAAFIVDAGVVLHEVVVSVEQDSVVEPMVQQPHIAEAIKKDQIATERRLKRYDSALQSIYDQHQIAWERCLDGGGPINPQCATCKVPYPCKTAEIIERLNKNKERHAI
ncbi:hypothetical protein GCM10009720_16010 [Yaniella flava]|uniref:Uncharacterized protein n=1 Tax=Yaniella flava TaxID=287930 RepID=A0ABP5FXY3_9MICC